MIDKPIFENAYLRPILDYSNLGENGLILLVDIKKYSIELINELNAILSKHGSRFVSRQAPLEVDNKIKVILSGDIPRQEILQEQANQYLFIDGRFNDEDLNSSSEIVPLISMDITELTNANIDNKDVVSEVIDKVHSKGKLIRFWKTNDRASVWLTLIDLKVDMIGVDHLERFFRIMKKNSLAH